MNDMRYRFLCAKDKVKLLWLDFPSHCAKLLNSPQSASIISPVLSWRDMSQTRIPVFSQKQHFHFAKLRAFILSNEVHQHLLCTWQIICWWSCCTFSGFFAFHSLVGCIYFYFLFFLSQQKQTKLEWSIWSPPDLLFFPRSLRWTAIILIAADKRFPWHTISPYYHLVSSSSTCLSILTTSASRLSLACLNWWSNGPSEQNTLQASFFSSERQNK